MPAALFVDADGDDVTVLSIAATMLRAEISDISCSADYAEEQGDAVSSSIITEKVEYRDRESTIDGNESIFDPLSSIVDLFGFDLRFLRRGGGSLLFDDFYDLAGVGLLVELQDKILCFDRVAFVIELNGASDAFEPLYLAHCGGYVGAAGLFARVGFEPLFHCFDADQRGVIAVETKGFDIFAETLLVFFRKGGGFRIRVRWAKTLV
jgi:hypothetical protein